MIPINLKQEATQRRNWKMMQNWRLNKIRTLIEVFEEARHQSTIVIMSFL